MTIYNVLVPVVAVAGVGELLDDAGFEVYAHTDPTAVVALVEALTAQAAVSRLQELLREAGFTPYESERCNAFVSEEPESAEVLR